MKTRRSWGAGYRAAQAPRAEITASPGERLTTTQAIASKLGAATFSTMSAVPGVLALVARDDQDIHIHLRYDETMENQDRIRQACASLPARELGAV